MRLLGSTLLALCCLIVAGCAAEHNPHPQMVGGQYYIMGDEDCVKYGQNARQRQEGAIACYAEDGSFTGLRMPMSEQAMRMWAMERQVQIDQSRAALEAWSVMNQNRPVNTNCYYIGNMLHCTQY